MENDYQYADPDQKYTYRNGVLRNLANIEDEKILLAFESLKVTKRVEELFEARKPKGLAIVTELSGASRMEDTKKKRIVVITSNSGEEVSYDIPFGSRLKISNGDFVSAGDEINESD